MALVGSRRARAVGGSPGLSVIWRGRTDNHSLTPAAIGEERLLLAGDTTAEAWSLDGDRLWRRALATPAHFAPRPAGNRIALVGRQGASLLDATDGRPVWQATPDKAFGAPLVHGRHLLLGDGSDLVAFALADGTPVWRHSVQGNAGIFYAPAGWRGTVYLGGGDGRLTALDGESGAVRWSVDGAARWQYLRQLALTADGQVLVAGGYDDAVYGLDPVDGALLWRFDAGNFVNSQLAQDGDVYFWSPTGWVIALDARTGARRWRVRTHRFGADGGGDWAPIMAEVRASGPWLWVLDLAHRLHVLDRATGREVATLDLPFPVRPFVTPTAQADQLIFGTTEGNVALLRVDDLR